MNNSLVAKTFTWGCRFSAIALLLAGLLMVMQPAWADGYEVTITDNDGLGSLRQAITDAYNHPGADIITFAADTDGTPIVLSGFTGDDANASGDLDILDGGNLTIQGNGAGITIIDGGKLHRVFHICPGGGCANLVILDGVTIQNGSVAEGGGLYIGGGTTTVSASTIISNRANLGGGIFNDATLNVQSSSIIGGAGTSNTADTNGGGIYNRNGTVTVDASSVISNTATQGGGGIFSMSGTVMVDACSVISNTAIRGGGICIGNAYGTLNVQNGSIIGKAGAGNTATDGGGIYNMGTITVTGSTVSANSATETGGGILNSPDGIATVDGSTVSANTAGTRGGGIYNLRGLTVDDSTISANRAADGGGIYFAAGFFYGGTRVTGSRIVNNTATNNGGGMIGSYLFEGSARVTGNCIVGNSATSFFNTGTEQQTATGNWWGASGGPNTPGADTYGGNVDVSGHLTAPILGCGPDLQISKANDTGGDGTAGTPFHWTLTVTNTGLVSATFDALETILVDELPAIGPTYGQPVPDSFVNVANSANIGCSIVSNVLTCTAAGGDVILGPATSGFKVTFSVTQDTPMTVVNPSGVCRIDPDGNVLENDENNNDCPADVVNVVASITYVYLPVVLK